MPASRVAALRRLLATVLLCTLLGPVVGAQSSQPDEIVARRYDVRLTVLPDGSLDVVETIRLTAGATPMTWFERTIPADHTDGLQLAGVSLDRNPLSGERNGLGLRVRGRRDLTLRVTFAPTSRADRVIEIRYRARHVVAMDGGRPRLRWTALPARHDYPIQRASISVSAPAGAEAREVRAEGGLVGSGEDGGLMVTTGALARRDTVTLDVVFVPGTLVPTDPIWFRDQERARDLIPAFVSSGLVLLVIGLGVLAMIYAQDRRWRLVVAPGQAADVEPLDPALAPGLASLLVANGRARQWLSLQAAFFGLVQRGAIAIVPAAAGTWRRPARFDVRVASGAAAWTHEQWILDAIGAQAASADGVDLRRCARRLFRKQRAFHACLEADARGLGWMEPERAKTAAGLRATGVGLVLFAVILAVVVSARLAHLGPAAQLVPLGCLVDGVLFVLASSVMGRLSERGERAAVAWRARATEMRQVSRGGRVAAGDPAVAEAVGQWLPFAVGVGIGRAWVKAHAALLSAGGAEARWMAAFGGAAGTHAAVLAVISASGAAHAGSNGVTGAGGGTSSAG